MPLRIDQILQALKAALEAFSQEGLGGNYVSVARDPFNVFELLNMGPKNYKLVLLWNGDQNISEIEWIPLLRHSLEVVFGYSLGLSAKPDLALIQPMGDRPALYTLLDNLRTTLLNLRFGSDQTAGQLEYQRAESVVTPDGVPLAAYRLLFGLRALPGQAPEPTTI